MPALVMLNLLLALLWMLLWGVFDIWSLLAGLTAGYLLLGLCCRALGIRREYGQRFWRLLSFSGYFIYILIKANLQVAWEVITPGLGMTPRFVKYDVSDLTPAQITTLANSISLTPGTLSVDVDERGQWLLVHCMYAGDRAAAIKDLDDLRDRILKEIFA